MHVYLRDKDAAGMNQPVNLLRILIQKLQRLEDVGQTPHAPRHELITICDACNRKALIERSREEGEQGVLLILRFLSLGILEPLRQRNRELGCLRRITGTVMKSYIEHSSVRFVSFYEL